MSAAADAITLRELFGEKILGTVEFRGEQTVLTGLASLHDVLAKCKNDLGYEMILDISSIDHFGDDPRFEIVYEIATLDDSKHLRVKAPVGEDEKVPSVTDLWVGRRAVAFGRGDRGFVVVNGNAAALEETLTTSLPPGTYCDVVTGVLDAGACTGREVAVADDGTVDVRLDGDTALAVHVGARR